MFFSICGPKCKPRTQNGSIPAGSKSIMPTPVSGCIFPKTSMNYPLSRKTGNGNCSFEKNHYRIGRYLERFGENIIVQDHMDWTTDEIVKVSLDRYMVEKAFRQTHTSRPKNELRHSD